MKDKLLLIRGDEEFFSGLEHLRKSYGFKTIAETVRKILENECKQAKVKERKIQCYPDSKAPWAYFLNGVGCDCGANCFHYEYDGKTIYGVCNACGKDLYTVKPEYVADTLNTGIWE